VPDRTNKIQGKTKETRKDEDERKGEERAVLGMFGSVSRTRKGGSEAALYQPARRVSWSVRPFKGLHHLTMAAYHRPLCAKNGPYNQCIIVQR
jgi:hypothetical protein